MKYNIVLFHRFLFLHKAYICLGKKMHSLCCFVRRAQTAPSLNTSCADSNRRLCCLVFSSQRLVSASNEAQAHSGSLQLLSLPIEKAGTGGEDEYRRKNKIPNYFTTGRASVEEPNQRNLDSFSGQRGRHWA